MSSLDPATCCPARYFAMAPTSPNVSLRSRSLSETRKPLPVTPFWRATHSDSVKSVFVVICIPIHAALSGRSLARTGPRQSSDRTLSDDPLGSRMPPKLQAARQPMTEEGHHDSHDQRRRGQDPMSRSLE